MAKNQWNELLLEQVRQLPMASSKEQVQLRLNLLIVEASKQKKRSQLNLNSFFKPINFLAQENSLTLLVSFLMRLILVNKINKNF